MKRRERKNMVAFISKVKGTEEKHLSTMTDEDIEHIYEQTYLAHENTE
ncbi:BH0509 family protein [Alteribacillus sp. JSM 102045]